MHHVGFVWRHIGGRKSLTSQHLVILFLTCTLVLSPLVSLIQVMIIHLSQENILTTSLTGHMWWKGQQQLHHKLESHSCNCMLMYVMPNKIYIFQWHIFSMGMCTRGNHCFPSQPPHAKQELCTYFFSPGGLFLWCSTLVFLSYSCLRSSRISTIC
jgi:hypothetical protein